MPLSVPSCPHCGQALVDAARECPVCTPTRTDAGGVATEATGLTGRKEPTGQAPPKHIAGYTVVREIRIGGQAAVYEAWEETMRRRVALKVLSRHHGSSETAERRFQHEAWIQGKLDHPAIVRVFEQGVWEELRYYSMEYVEGASLDDIIDRLRQTGRDDDLGLIFSTPEYLDWVLSRTIEAAEGLDFAHRHEVVHRDVKPANLLFSRKLKRVRI